MCDVLICDHRKVRSYCFNCSYIFCALGSNSHGLPPLHMVKNGSGMPHTLTTASTTRVTQPDSMDCPFLLSMAIS